MTSLLEIRIRVRGRLSARLAGAFDGLQLVRRDGATELVGEVVDQTQLHGLLGRIRDLGLELQSVSVIDKGDLRCRRHDAVRSSSYSGASACSPRSPSSAEPPR